MEVLIIMAVVIGIMKMLPPIKSSRRPRSRSRQSDGLPWMGGRRRR